MEENLLSVSLHDVEEAQKKIKSSVFRTPLVPLNLHDEKRKVCHAFGKNKDLIFHYSRMLTHLKKIKL